MLDRLLKLKSLHILLGSVITGALIVIAAYFKNNGIRGLTTLKDEIETVDSEISSLKKRNADLVEIISKARSDRFYIEKIARTKLSMTKPGEVVFVFLDDDPRLASDRSSLDFSESQ